MSADDVVVGLYDTAEATATGSVDETFMVVGTLTGRVNPCDKSRHDTKHDVPTEIDITPKESNVLMQRETPDISAEGLPIEADEQVNPPKPKGKYVEQYYADEDGTAVRTGNYDPDYIYVIIFPAEKAMQCEQAIGGPDETPDQLEERKRGHKEYRLGVMSSLLKVPVLPSAPPI